MTRVYFIRGIAMAILLSLKIQEQKIENSRFRLTQIATQRAKMLIRGAKPLVETSYTKAITIALQEIQAGKVSCYDSEEAAKIREGLQSRVKEQEEAETKAIREKEISRAKASKEKKEADA